MDGHRSNMNKSKRQEFIVPERRGTEFLLEPPEQRPVTEPSSGSPPKDEAPKIVRAKAEKFLSVASGSRKNLLEKNTKPSLLVSKYFTNTPQPITKFKPRKTTAEKTVLRPIIPTDAQRKTPLKYQKSPDQITPQHISWNTSENGSRPIPPRARDIVRPPPGKIPYPAELSEPVRPKTPGTPGRRQENEEEIVPEVKAVPRKEMKKIAADKQKVLVDPQVEPYYLSKNKNSAPIPGKRGARIVGKDKEVMYIFTPPGDEGSSDDSNSDEAFMLQSGFGQNINLAELAQNAQKKAQRFESFRDDGLESYDSVDMLENSTMPGLKDLAFESELKMPEKPKTIRKKKAGSQSARAPKITQYDSEFEDRPLTARPMTAITERDEPEYYAESATSMAGPHKLFETEDINVLTDRATLKVNNLHDSMGYDDLMALFPKASSVTYPMYDRSGPPTMKPTRYCYVLYDDVRDAKEAFEKMDAFVTKGLVLDIEYRHYNS